MTKPSALAFGVARRDRDLLSCAPAVTLTLCLAPIGAGLIGTWLPAFGWLPSLGGRELSLAPWRTLLAAPELPGALRLTITTGVLATLLSLALTIGFCATSHGTAIFRFMQRGLAPLLAIPHAAMAIGLAFVIAPSGWLVRLASPTLTGWQTPPDIATLQDPFGLALVLGLTLKEAPYLLLMTLAAIGQADAPRRLMIARSLGYGRTTAWLKVVLPAVYPQIRLPVFVVLAYSLSVVDMAIILAPTTPAPLAPLLWRWFNDGDLTMRFAAAAGATLQLLVVTLSIAAWHLGERAIARAGRRWIRRGARGQQDAPIRLVGRVAMIGVIGLSAFAIAGLALWSVAARWRFPDALPSQWTLMNWVDESAGLAEPLALTLAIGVACGIVALVLSLGCLENEQRHGLHLTNRGLWLIYVPLLVPQISFLFGVQVMFVGFAIDGTFLALLWSHGLFVLPFVFLALADPARALDERFARSALCLGASPNRIFWAVKLPMLRRAVATAFAVGFAVSVAQYLPTLFAGGGRLTTLTTEAVSRSAGADRRAIAVLVLVQALLPVIPFAIAALLPLVPHPRRRMTGVVEQRS